MGVGYAAFSSLLTINGTANISNSWCVGFDNTKTSDLQITKGLSTGTTPTGSMSYSGTACGTNLVPTSSLSSHFYQPGDQIEYTLTITNKSTVTAAIKSILVDNESVTSDTTKNKDNITYIIEMPESTTLAPNDSTTMKVIAKFQNETDVTGPYSGETKTIEVKINAEQDDGNGGFTPTPAKFTGTFYQIGSLTTEYLANKDSVAAADYRYRIENLSNNPYFTGVNLLTYTDRLTVLGDYYLKHDIVNDEIINSYVCFIYNNQEHCMKGGVDECQYDSSVGDCTYNGEKIVYNSNVQIIQDYQSFYNLPNNAMPGCYFGSFSSSCRGGVFYEINARSDGSVELTKGNWGCTINFDGLSYCGCSD